MLTSHREKLIDSINQTGCTGYFIETGTSVMKDLLYKTLSERSSINVQQMCKNTYEKISLAKNMAIEYVKTANYEKQLNT